jgi:hypothetical protein
MRRAPHLCLLYQLPNFNIASVTAAAAVVMLPHIQQSGFRKNFAPLAALQSITGINFLRHDCLRIESILIYYSNGISSLAPKRLSS